MFVLSSALLNISIVVFIIKGFRIIVFIFIVISTIFQEGVESNKKIRAGISPRSNS